MPATCILNSASRALWFPMVLLLVLLSFTLLILGCRHHEPTPSASNCRFFRFDDGCDSGYDRLMMGCTRREAIVSPDQVLYIDASNSLRSIRLDQNGAGIDGLEAQYQAIVGAGKLSSDRDFDACILDIGNGIALIGITTGSHTSQVVSIRIKDGHVLWKRKLSENANPGGRFPFDSRGLFRVVGDKVFVYDGSTIGILVLSAMDGNEIMRISIGEWHGARDLIVAGNRAFLIVNEGIGAVSLLNTEERYLITLGYYRSVDSLVAYGDDRLAVLSTDDRSLIQSIDAYSVPNGMKLWTVRPDLELPDYCKEGLALTGNLLCYYTTISATALDVKSGKVLWSTNLCHDTQVDRVISTPVVGDKLVAVRCLESVKVLESETGDVCIEFRLPTEEHICGLGVEVEGGVGFQWIGMPCVWSADDGRVSVGVLSTMGYAVMSGVPTSRAIRPADNE